MPLNHLVKDGHLFEYVTCIGTTRYKNLRWYDEEKQTRIEKLQIIEEEKKQVIKIANSTICYFMENNFFD